MNTSLLLGLDPGFASVGWCVLSLEESREDVVAMGVFRTEKADAKRKVLAADDNFRRAREIVRLLRPKVDNVQAICAESMSFPRNSSAAAKMAMSWGVVACMSELFNIPVVQATPKEVKKAVCSNGSATKEEIEAALRARYAGRLSASLLADVPRSCHEHAWDALAACVACFDSEVVRLARRMKHQ
jgi:crossover junction endodeoxyribonuclease RuvC